MENKKTEFVSFKAHEDLVESLEAVAMQTKRSRSDVIRLLLDEALEARRSKENKEVPA